MRPLKARDFVIDCVLTGRKNDGIAEKIDRCCIAEMGIYQMSRPHIDWEIIWGEKEMNRRYRNYNHKDFSELLSELQKKQQNTSLTRRPESQKPAAAPAPAMSLQRQRLFSDERNKFFYSKEQKTLHDKSCPAVKLISDANLRCRSVYDEKMSQCEACAGKAYARAAAKDLIDIPMYQSIFAKLGLSEKQIRRLIVELKPDASVTTDALQLKIKDHVWRLKASKRPGRVYLLYQKAAGDVVRREDFAPLEGDSGSSEPVSVKQAIETIMKYTAEKRTRIRKPQPVPPVPHRKILLNDHGNRFFYDEADRVIHDRTCPEVKRIPEQRLKSLEAFDKTMPRCPRCERKACIRAGAKDMEKYGLYQQVLPEMGISLSKIRTIFVSLEAETTIEPGVLTLKAGGDTWKLWLDGGQHKLLLLHNNYALNRNGKRSIEKGFHLQYEYAMSIEAALKRIENYDFEAHRGDLLLRRMKREKSIVGRAAYLLAYLRYRLEAVPAALRSLAGKRRLKRKPKEGSRNKK